MFLIHQHGRHVLDFGVEGIHILLRVGYDGRSVFKMSGRPVSWQADFCQIDMVQAVFRGIYPRLFE